MAAKQQSNKAAMQALLQAYKKAEAECTLPKFFSYAEPISGDYTYHKIITIISGVCALITVIVSLSHTYFHIVNYVNPGEQRQIIRIVLITAIYANFNLWCAKYYDQAGFLEPIAQLYECLALCATFLLFIQYVAPNEETRLEFFHTLGRLSRGSTGQKKRGHGSLKWFYGIWLCVFQHLPVRLATTTASGIIQSVVCPLNQKTLKLVITAVQSTSAIVGLFAILNFYYRLEPTLREHGARTKLLIVMCVIAVNLTQNILFPAFLSAGILKPSKKASFRDLQTGTPAFMTCCEMLIFSIGLLWPFTPKSYFPGQAEKQYQKRYISGVWFRYKLIGVYSFRKKPATQITLTLKVWDDRRASVTVDSLGSNDSGRPSSEGSSASEGTNEPGTVRRIQRV